MVAYGPIEFLTSTNVASSSTMNLSRLASMHLGLPDPEMAIKWFQEDSEFTSSGRIWISMVFSLNLASPATRAAHNSFMYLKHGPFGIETSVMADSIFKIKRALKEFHVVASTAGQDCARIVWQNEHNEEFGYIPHYNLYKTHLT